MSSKDRKLSIQSRAELRLYVTDHFKGEELRDLCHDLDVDYSRLHGKGQAKARELVAWLERDGRIDDLVRACERLRPNVPPPKPRYDPKPLGVLAVIRHFVGEFEWTTRRVMIVASTAVIMLLIVFWGIGREPLCSSLVMDPMDNLSGWDVYGQNADKPETRIVLGIVPGRTNKAIVAYYELGDPTQWVELEKNIQPGVLSGAEGIGFYYAGSGDLAAIGVKLIYQSKTTFSISTPRATSTDGWSFFLVPYGDFVCWTDTGCSENEKVDMSQVTRIEISIKSLNGQVGRPNRGFLVIDDIQAIKPWSWICTQ